MKKHDGTWQASLDGHGAYSIDSQDGQVCFVRDPRCARLIAAAPELFAALQCEEALDKPTSEGYEILERHGWNPEGRFEMPASEFVRRLRRAAMAKATPP